VEGEAGILVIVESSDKGAATRTTQLRR